MSENTSKALKIALLVGQGLILVGAYLWVPPHEGLGNLGRIAIFHIPTAWVATVAFLVAMFYGIQYLRTRRLDNDLRSAASAELGLLFTILATITGTIFGRFTWGLQSGIWWNWDPRETAIFVLLLIYGAYFALRSAVADEERRASLSAVYSILAFVTVPFLIFVIPRVMFSLHPENALAGEGATAGILRNPRTMIIFLASLVSTTGIYIWTYSLRLRLGQLERRLLET